MEVEAWDRGVLGREGLRLQKERPVTGAWLCSLGETASNSRESDTSAVPSLLCHRGDIPEFLLCHTTTPGFPFAQME